MAGCELQAEQQLLAQFAAIQDADAPVHCPCAAQVTHMACESVPRHDGVVTGRGATVTAGEVGAAVHRRGAAVAGAASEQQLLAQFAAIQAADEPVHCPCAAHPTHEDCAST